MSIASKGNLNANYFCCIVLKVKETTWENMNVVYKNTLEISIFSQDTWTFGCKKKVFMCIVSYNTNIGITLDVQIYKRKMFSNYILKHP
jgi:hypothetical protein